LGTVSGNVVSASHQFDDALEPGGAEEKMVRVFRANGPVLGWDRLLELCVAAGMNPITVGIYASISPVVARLAPGIYSLVGATVPPGLVEEIEQGKSAARKPAEYGWSPRGTLWCAIRVTLGLLTSGSVRVPTFVADLVEGDEWQVRLGGRTLEKTLKCRNHFLWSLSRALAQAGAEPEDMCVLEFDLRAHTVDLTIGSDELVDAWESGDIEIPPPDVVQAEDGSE
jgi:hypothetical protein